MLTSKLLRSLVGALLALTVLGGLVLLLSPEARADVVFITRIGNVQTTYPRSNAFSVGTTSSSVAKLSVYAYPSDTFTRIFEVASSSSAGTTGDLLKVDRNGCIQMIATSTATPIKLVLEVGSTTGSTGQYFVTKWGYGSCL